MAFDEYYREFGRRVRSARARRSQADVAADAGVTRALVANVETGRYRVTLDVLDRLARALDVAPAELLPPIPAYDDGLPAIAEPTAQRAVERLRTRAGITNLGPDASS